jgi:hypothetical protein
MFAKMRDTHLVRDGLFVRSLAGGLLSVLAVACQDPTLRQPLPQVFRLVEKGPYQSLYGADGRIVRLVYDRNGDGVADAVLVYDSGGNVQEASLDTDLDAVIDRWEYFEAGVLVKVGFSRRRRGAPDTWDLLTGGALTVREYDDDGDGSVDRREPLR